MSTPRGSARFKRGKWFARLRFGNGLRLEQVLPWATEEGPAKARAQIMADAADKLVAAGRADLVRGMCRELARASTEDGLARARATVAVILKGEKSIRTGKDVTVKQWGKHYTSGDLAKKFPDHVYDKDYRKDAGRLRMYVYPIVGDVPVRAFNLSHGNAVMRALPAHLSPTSRRHVAQALMRIMHLAVFPGQLVVASPLPRGWLPKLHAKDRKHYSCLFPREEGQFLEHDATAIAIRLFFGVLAREGMRLSELWDSAWWQWNLVEGTFTTAKTKTGDSRMWAIRPDVARAMAAWKALHPKLVRPFAELDDLIGDRTKTAGVFRESLKAAGVDRAELHESTEHTGKLRAHDARAMFVTVSLAEGRTETWIRDRTAHKSTSMIDRYRRQARQFEELKLGSFVDLSHILSLGGTRGATTV